MEWTSSHQAERNAVYDRNKVAVRLMLKDRTITLRIFSHCYSNLLWHTVYLLSFHQHRLARCLRNRRTDAVDGLPRPLDLSRVTYQPLPDPFLIVVRQPCHRHVEHRAEVVGHFLRPGVNSWKLCGHPPQRCRIS